MTRMPITVASKKGVSAVAAAAQVERVVLTNHGHPVAVVDSAERIDETVRMMREAASAVLDWAASRVAGRGETMGFEELCSRAGVDPASVMSRIHDDASPAA
jgi:PHD/YefM family antitoxin component YafN of YafNO toxin-antitoxin module